MGFKFELGCKPGFDGVHSYNLSINRRTKFADVLRFVHFECGYTSYAITLGPLSYLKPKRVLVERRNSKFVKLDYRFCDTIKRRRCEKVVVYTSYSGIEFEVTLKERWIDRFCNKFGGVV